MLQGVVLTKKRSRKEFERVMLPHLNRAYKLASWLLRHRQDAEEAVQQSYLKAYRAFDQYLGGDSAAWMLKIVRNTCMTMLNQRNRSAKIISIDRIIDTQYGGDETTFEKILKDSNKSPEEDLLDKEIKKIVWDGVDLLSLEFREIIILREFIGLNYQEISETVGIPTGTVMSRLSRARKQLHKNLSSFEKEYRKYEL